MLAEKNIKLCYLMLRYATLRCVTLCHVSAGEDFVHAVAADDQYQGDLERAGQRILKDFRSGALGAFALELPPKR